MPDLTEEEYDALDEYWTKITPKVGPNGTGFVSRREARIFGLDDLSADYLLTKAIADHKTPAEIIGEMVRERGLPLQQFQLTNLPRLSFVSISSLCTIITQFSVQP
jgi:hypothetical protein